MNNVMNEYPYFLYPDLMALRSADCPEEEKERLRRKIAALTGDIPSLRIILGLDPEEFAAFYPDMASVTPSTEDTIDAFLEKFSPTERPAPSANSPEKAEHPKKSEPIEKIELSPGELMQKADFLIKNRQYEEALEIINSLNLKNPEKSVYFADQMRFLRKLVRLKKAGMI